MCMIGCFPKLRMLLWFGVYFKPTLANSSANPSANLRKSSKMKLTGKYSKIRSIWNQLPYTDEENVFVIDPTPREMYVFHLVATNRWFVWVLTVPNLTTRWRYSMAAAGCVKAMIGYWGMAHLHTGQTRNTKELRKSSEDSNGFMIRKYR